MKIDFKEFPKISIEKFAEENDLTLVIEERYIGSLSYIAYFNGIVDLDGDSFDYTHPITGKGISKLEAVKDLINKLQFKRVKSLFKEFEMVIPILTIEKTYRFL